MVHDPERRLHCSGDAKHVCNPNPTFWILNNKLTGFLSHGPLVDMQRILVCLDYFHTCMNMAVFCRVSAQPLPPFLHLLDRFLLSAHSGVKVLIKVNWRSEVAVAEGDGAAVAATVAALLLGACIS